MEQETFISSTRNGKRSTVGRPPLINYRRFVTIRWIRSNCFSIKAGDLVVVSYAGAGIVYAFKLGATDDSITRLQAVPAEPRPGMSRFFQSTIGETRTISWTRLKSSSPINSFLPDGTTFLSAGADFVTGELYYGSKLNNTLRAFGLATRDGRPGLLRYG